MNKIKLEYEAPEVNTLEVKFEANLLTGSDSYDPNGIEKGNSRDGDEEGYYFG